MLIIVCDLTPVEFFSLLYRRVRDGSITPADALTLQTGYLFDHEEEYLSVPLSMDVLTRARSLLAQYPLRSLDALQLAGAVEATRLLSEPMIFVSSDRNLLSAAMGEGFNTDNPLLHP